MSAHVCTHCGTGGFWSSVADTFRRLNPFRKRTEDRLSYIPVDTIQDNPVQPREYILDEPHENLKKSIDRYGIIVPIIVNKAPGGHVLVAGQRRLKAARDLGFKFIPAIVRHLDRRQMLEVSYLENLHREDLSKVDQVVTFDRLLRRYPNLAEAELAKTMGLNPDDISHARRFLQMPIPIQEALRAGMISEQHAYVVEELPDPDHQLEVIELVYNGKMDVEATRELVDRMLRKEPPFVSSDDGVHFHKPACPYAQLIPDNRRMKYYSKKEPAKRGKIACMHCL